MAHELTILIPCLNEFETLGTVIEKASKSLSAQNFHGSIVVADNGSTDGSQQLARALGARVIDVPTRGYGSALIAGIEACESKFVIMGDADDSYALDDLQLFISKLDEGFDLVMGNRFQGGWLPAQCPGFINILGTPFLAGLDAFSLKSQSEIFIVA
jgi:glycosyltransferase involved in cell wall biosynthesis